MKSVFTFGVLGIRKSNPILAYRLSSRNLELTSVFSRQIFGLNRLGLIS